MRIPNSFAEVLVRGACYALFRAEGDALPRGFGGWVVWVAVDWAVDETPHPFARETPARTGVTPAIHVRPPPERIAALRDGV
jgi:hypothetical protein